MVHSPFKCFTFDLNWSGYDSPTTRVFPSAAQDWAFIDPKAYFDFHVEMGHNWFCYGSLKPDFQIQPAPVMAARFREVTGKPLPDRASEISAADNLAYKREALARQFRQIQQAVRRASPATKIAFNVPYWQPAEALWVNHPMLNESDGLFAECSEASVVEWLLSIRKPHQHVMTTIIGCVDSEGICDPNTWRKWHAKGCDLFVYAWGTPPALKPSAFYDSQLKVLRDALHAIA